MEKENIIRIKGASMTHVNRGEGRRAGNNLVLTDVNLEVGEGEMVYLIGKIGSGKSTFLKTLYGEIPLTSGEGSIVGFNLNNLRKRDVPRLRRSMGIVFQDLQLLPDRNVYENLNFVLRATGWKKESDIRKRIEEILEMVDLTHKIYKMPHHLSGGEQQRLAIGRAFLNEPRILLADEPTRNLDPKSIDEIMELFCRLRDKGCSLLIATHDIFTIKSYISRTLFFDSGTVKEVDMNAFIHEGK